MKKFYVCALLVFFAFGFASAQTYFWIGPNGGDWANGNNWSTLSGGSPAGTYPQSTSHNVILDVNAVISLNTSVSINSISVTGSNTSAKITATGGSNIDRTITVNSTNAGAPALNIASTCRLENSANNATFFAFVFAPDAQGSVSGDWYFTGDIESDAVAYYELPLSGASTALNINSGGSITIAAGAFIHPNEDTGNDFLIFKAGSSLNLLGDGPIIPVANYHAASIINITGVISASAFFEESEAVGIVNYNCPGQNNGGMPLYLSLLTFSVDGNLNILNTNNNELTLLSYTSTTGLPSRDATIKGNLNIQGNSFVSVAHNDGPELDNNLTVEGNVIMNGTTLSLHTGTYVSSSRTRLIVKGNIQHTAGVLTALSSVTNETNDLYVIEMNGSSAQTISSVTNSFDNAGHQVTLRMNNAAGASLLTSLAVGRIDFSSSNKGVVSTGSNTLTINNTTPASASSIVVHSPGANAYVNGTIQRKTASNEPAILPVGNGGYRGVTVIPSSNTASTFQAKYFNTGYSDLSVLSPLEGVSPDYYWDITRIGAGADAVIQLSIPGAVTGSQSGYGLVVAKYNGADWANARGTTGTMVTPGDATSGSVKTELQTSFSPFTIGFGQQAALPTLLVSFEGRKTAKGEIHLNWEITNNSTPEVFDVMRSGDGLHFNKIGTVRGEETVRTYRYTDNNILAGNNYYRLKMSDKDGSVTNSIIVVVSNGTRGVSLNAVAPTIVTNRTKLSIQSSANTNMTLVVTDINGRIVHKQSVTLMNGHQDVWLETARLSPGVFQVTGYVSEQNTSTLRFIKL